MEKKNIFTIIGISLLLILLIVGCFVGGENNTKKITTTLSNDPQVIYNNAKKESDAITENEQGELTEIKIDTYLEYLAGESKKAILIARPTCRYCQIAEPIIKKIIKDYNVEINYLNTDGFEGDDTARFTASDETFTNGFGTPMLIVVSNGKIIDKVDGLTDTAHYIDFLKSNEIIK